MTDGQRIALAKPGDMAPVSSPDAREADLFRDNSPLTWEYVRERLGEGPRVEYDNLHRYCKAEAGAALTPGGSTAFVRFEMKFHGSGDEEWGDGGLILSDHPWRYIPVRTVADLQCALHLMRWDDAQKRP